MLWKFNPNQERSAFFDTVLKLYTDFAMHQNTIADVSKIIAFCNELCTATIKMRLAAANASETLSPDERRRIIETTNAIIDFHEEYCNTKVISHITDPAQTLAVGEKDLAILKIELSGLGQKLAKASDWEYKLSGKYPQIDPSIAFERNHANRGPRPN